MKFLGGAIMLGGFFGTFVCGMVYLMLSGWAEQCKPEEVQSINYLRERAKVFGFLTWILGIASVLGLVIMVNST